MEKVLITYQAPVDSYPLNQARAGMMGPGRYTGFDELTVISSGAGFSGTLKSSVDTLMAIDENNQILDPQGVLMTPHGVVIKSSEEYILAISQNSTLDIRKDIIYCEYSWVETEGGGSMLWGIIQGTENGVIPELSSSNIQTRVGVITIPKNATAGDITYTPDPVPLPGGVDLFENFPELEGTFAKLNASNHFTKVQSFNFEYRELEMDEDNGIILGDGANYFNMPGLHQNVTIKNFVIAPGVQFSPGTRIGIYFYNTGLDSNFAPSSNSTSEGYHIIMSHVTGISNPNYLHNIDRTGDYYEFVLDNWKTWHCVNAPEYLARQTKKQMGTITLINGTEMRTNRTANVVYKVGNIVTVDAGFIAGLEASNNTPSEIAQLPLGFIPTQPLEIPVVLVPPGAAAGQRTGTVLIGLDGTIRAYHHGTLNTSLGCMLNIHVSFSTS